MFKNRYYGFFLYASARAYLENSLIAENAYNLELRWCDHVNVTDVDIRGIAPSTMELTHPPYLNKPCSSSGFYSPIGYRMQTAIHRYYWGETNRGAKLENVGFTHFDYRGQCSSSVAIDFNTRDKRDGEWDYLSSFTNVTVSGDKIMDAKSADEEGIRNIIISDPDGSSNPSLTSPLATNKQSTVAGSFVMNKGYLTDLAHGDCQIHYDGIAYCEDACYRTVELLASQTGSAGYDLQVIREDDGVEVYFPAFYEYDDNFNRSLYEDHSRKYTVSLPEGSYQITFLDNGIPVWPQYVYELWLSKPPCEGYVSVSNVTIVEPDLEEGECDNLIKNGDMEKGLDGWTHRNSRSGDPGQDYLKALPGVGIGGSMAIGCFDRTSQYHGIGQNLDTRCFHENYGALYEVEVSFRLESSGEVFICDRFDGSYPNRCPKATLKNVSILFHFSNDITSIIIHQYFVFSMIGKIY